MLVGKVEFMLQSKEANLLVLKNLFTKFRIFKRKKAIFLSFKIPCSCDIKRIYG